MIVALPLLAGLLLGALAGSFLGTLVLRWSEGDSVMRGRSRCDGCGSPLWPRDLVPLASYGIARGRCRRCGAPIRPLHPAVEAGCAGIGAVALWLHPDLAGLAGALLGWLLLTLAVLDARHFWLPDALTLPLGAAGLASGVAGLAPSWNDRLIGAGAGFLLLAAVRHGFRWMRRRDGLGAGDPKLFACLGAWLGLAPLPGVLCGAALVGIAWALAQQARGRTLSRTTELPFGTMLAIAGWAAWLITT
jgi:leader peptidase (prepilin peptidase)/N-methyltransferase